MSNNCCINNCDNPVYNKGRALCKAHYQRWWLGHDLEKPLRRKNGTGAVTGKGYVMICIDGVRKYEHIWIAEKALGKPLPDGVVVHHVNGVESDNRPDNLVICPDERYHKLLHKIAKRGYI